jgi:hypothetical protein
MPSARTRTRIHASKTRKSAAETATFALRRLLRKRKLLRVRPSPAYPSPGFYPEDLSNPNQGKVLTSVVSHNVYGKLRGKLLGESRDVPR